MTRRRDDGLTRHGKRKGRPPKYLDEFERQAVYRKPPQSRERSKAQVTSASGEVSARSTDTLWVVRAFANVGVIGHADEIRAEMKRSGEGTIEKSSIKHRLWKIRTHFGASADKTDT